MNTKSHQTPSPRYPATIADVQRIAKAILAYQDPSKLVSAVILTEAQRRLIREAHALAMARRRNLKAPVIFVHAEGYVRFLQGGAPGLVQQRLRR